MASERPLPSIRERDIFFAAVEKPTPAERDAYLIEACGSDQNFLESIRSLISEHENGKTLVEIETTRLGEQIKFQNETIDRFRLLEQLGEGGGGSVFRAEQLQPFRRTVAIKILNSGIKGQRIAKRFEDELETLAALDHPYIAKVYDAGLTSAGSPFFAMELVNGLKVTEYADLKQMTIPQRLELFLKICGAVQHAHSKGIIHRDIKPSNILAHEQGTEHWPKVIDFGIAKIIAGDAVDQTALTLTGQIIGTPAYMSPEQARANGKIDGRADIYSLGVLLYELMINRLPFALAGKDLYEQLHAIINEAPLPTSDIYADLNAEQQVEVASSRQSDPQTLYNFLFNNLDRVVLTCLAKDPDKRYGSIAELAAEIERIVFSEGREAGTALNTKLSRTNVAMTAPTLNKSDGLWGRLARESITKTGLIKLFLPILGVSFLASWVIFPSFKSNGTTDLFVMLSCLFVIKRRWRFLLDGKWKMYPISCAAVIVSVILLLFSYPLIFALIEVQHAMNDVRIGI